MWASSGPCNWSFKNAVMTTAHSVLAKVKKIKCREWFDTECDHVTALKCKEYDILQQRYNR
jgi:hypothetical protein